MRLAYIVVLLLCWPQLSLAAFDSADVQHNRSPLSITRITPNGDHVSPSRQIVFAFNRPVVAIGEMSRSNDDIPIRIQPKLNCQWRWLNTTALACQLAEQDIMQPATQYTVSISPDLQAEDGSKLDHAYQHKFTTIRPLIRHHRFSNWQSPGTPVITLLSNQKVTWKSLQQRFYFELANGDRMDASVLRINPKQKTPNVRRFMLQPQHELPLDSKVKLNIRPGMIPAKGHLRGQEQRTIVDFSTFPKFRFLGLSCTDIINDKSIQIPPSGSRQRCNPRRFVSMRFSAPVIKEEVEKHVRLIPDLAGGRSDYNPWARLSSYSQLRGVYRQGREYSVVIPEYLKAHEDYQLLIQASLRDEFGRSLPAGVNTPFLTAHRQPNYQLNHHISVLEKGVDTHLPITVTNMVDAYIDYKVQTADQQLRQGQHVEHFAQVEDIAYRHPINIRQLTGESGVIYAKFQTHSRPTLRRHISNDALYGNIPTRNRDWFFSQVTPFDVHVKSGHFNTLVWVTDMRSGQPVPHAKVDIYLSTIDQFEHKSRTLASAMTDQDGIAMLDGSEKLDPGNEYRNFDEHHPELFVRVRLGKDIALLPLHYDFFVSPNASDGTYIDEISANKLGHIRTWGMTPQGVYKAGGTIDYKFYVRNQNNRKFTAAPSTSYHFTVVDPMGKKVHEVKNITLNKFGSYAGSFKVAKNAAVGWYECYLKSDFSDEEWNPMRVLVSDFTPSPFRVSSDLNGTQFQTGDKVEVSTMARLHAGGPFAQAQGRVTVRLSPTSIRVASPKAKGFHFNNSESMNNTVVHQSQGTLDMQGSLKTHFTMPASNVLYGTLAIESAVRDERGRYISGNSTATYIGRDQFVGVHQGDWLLHAGKRSAFSSIVIDANGKTMAKHQVAMRVEQRQTTASRVKGAGNAYLTQYNHRWQTLQRCQTTTGQDGSAASCAFTPPKTGYYRLIASIEDSQGRQHHSIIHRWAMGKGEVLWEAPKGYELQITAEKTNYKVGDTARYLIQNPYPGAMALITTERYGVMKHWVKRLQQSTEVIEVPIKADDLPGFYLSVMVVSPRVTQPMGKGNVDLGKPTFRIGYVKVPVVDPAKQIQVDVQPDRATHKPGEQVHIKLHTTLPQGKKQPVELAVAVLDEAVFDLIAGGSRKFDPYRGFYDLESLDMENYNLLRMLIGRQKFEDKGANAGGDGGPDLNLRSVFKFLSYWNPSLMTDKHGQAEVSFKLPDNLTGWRVLVLAVNQEDFMGLGEGHFKVNQATELRAALPNQVMEGDRFHARFSVMNRTPSARTIRMNVHAAGAIQGKHKLSKDLYVEPFKRHYLELPLRTQGAGEIVLTARAGDTLDQDAIRVRLPVLQRKSMETATSYGSSMKANISEAIRFPKNIREDMGSVSVVAAPSVINGVEPAFTYMRDYPYSCWEQKISVATMAAHYQQLRSYIADSFQWEESQGITQHTLDLAASYQAPNGGMVYYIANNRNVSPYLSAYTALVFNWLKKDGYTVPAQVEQRLHEYLRHMLRQEVLPSFYSSGMASTVRAVALAALAANGEIEEADLHRYYPHLQRMSLFGKAHYLQAVNAVLGGEDDSLAQTVVSSIMNSANESGGKLSFSEPADSHAERILSTSLRSNCAILSALLDVEESSQQATSTPFKLVRSISQSRNRHGYWQNTQENVFCMNAMTDFSRIYEHSKPNYRLSVSMDDKAMGKTVRVDDVRAKPVTFSRPIQSGDAGRETSVTLNKKGEGRYYYATRLSFSPKELKRERINAGLDVRREYSVQREGRWQLLHSPMHLKRGELVRVDLFISLPAVRNFVVVDDPVPGGLEPVNRQLATSSQVDADAAANMYAGESFWHSQQDWISYDYSRWSFYHKELRHHAARFYSEYLPAGNYHLSYSAQAIATGDFIVPPLHAEEMYDPDVFGQGAPAQLHIDEVDSAHK